MIVVRQLGVLILMTVLAYNTANSSPQDIAAIETIVESVGTLADRGNFEALEDLYANEVLMDYTSLAGGEPELKSPSAIMNEWAATLPGFDRTRHRLANINVELNEDRAVATADVTADHFVGELFWQVSGHYRYELARFDGDWKIIAHRFTLTDEAGTRDVFGPAAESAAASPAPYLQRQQTRDAVLRFLKALEDEDMAALESVFAENVVQDMPFSPEGHPKRVSGRDDLVALYSGWPDNAENADFTSELVFYPMQDASMVFAEFKGRVDIVPTGREYRQTYGGLFHVVDGEITLFREYYDPKPFAWAFGLE